MRNPLPTLLILILFSTTPLFTQKEIERDQHNAPVDSKDLKSLFIEANRIRTILYNSGTISGPGVVGNFYDFTWNGLGYGYEIGFLAGAKVPSSLIPTDSIKFIIDGFGASSKNMADGDFAPDGVTKWGWLPTKNFGNPNSKFIANNQDPSTWPVSWSQWNGKFGNAISDLELVYEMNDSTDAEFAYYPFPTDTSRRGLGLSVEARYYQFSHPNIEDVLFTFYEMKNVSTKLLTKMVAGIWSDPHIGGPNNFADDAQEFNTEHSLMYSWDPDEKGDIPIIAPGYFGMTYLTTPANKGVTSYAALFFGGNNRPKNDSLVYNTLSEGSKLTSLFYSSNSSNLGDFILLMGSGFYSLAPNQKEELGVSYLFAQDLQGLIERKVIVLQEYNIRFGKPGSSIVLTSPAPGQVYTSNTIDIQWTTSPLDADTTIDLFYSNTPDEKWVPIAKNIINDGSYQWNIASLRDGIFYKLHILKKKDGFVSYDSLGGYFTINKQGDAAPEIQLLSPKNIKLVKNTFPVHWLAGDPDGDAVSIKISLSADNGFTYTVLDQVANSGIYLFDTRKVANSPISKIKIEAAANGETSAVESKAFQIANFFFGLTDTASLRHVTGPATGEVIPGIVDSSALTGNMYQISFDSLNGGLRYRLKNITKNSTAFENESMTFLTGSGRLIDGMRIWFKNDPVGLDSVKSGFTTVVNNIVVQYKKPTAGIIRHAPIDLKFTFGSFDTTANGNYLQPLDSAGTTSNPSIKTVRVPFKVSIVDDTTKVQLLIRESASGGKLLRWDLSEEIVVFTPPQYRLTSNNTHAGLIFNKIDLLNASTISPGALYIARTTRPFSKNDIFEFKADAKYGKPTSIQKGENIPKNYVLEQNYPNPFNPETKIQFSIIRNGWTTLKIYDAIGREVKTLIDEELQEGSYTLMWDGRNEYNQPSASGVYFYRLHSGSFAAVKKMMLLR